MTKLELETQQSTSAPPPQYAQAADNEPAPPPYSQQGPPLPARRQSQPPPTPPRRDSAPTTETPPASAASRPLPTPPEPVAGPSSNRSAPPPASAKTSKSKPGILTSLARLHLSPRKPTSTSPLDKPLPLAPQEPPPVPPPSSRHARPVSYAGSSTNGLTRPLTAHARSRSTQALATPAAPPIPMRPTGPPVLSPPPIAVHAGLVGPNSSSPNNVAVPHSTQTGGTWSVGQAVPNGRAPNPFADLPPLPRRNQPKAQSEPGGRRRPHPAIAAYPGPPPPRHPVARGVAPAVSPARRSSTPPPRHPIASSRSSFGLAAAASSPTTPAPTSSPAKQKPAKAAKAPSGVPISASLYAAVSKKKSKDITPPASPSAVVTDVTIVDNSPPRRASLPPRAARAASQSQPRTPSQNRTPGPSTSSPTDTVRCSGFTRAGMPCKRLVKARAPYLLQRDMNADDDDSPRAVGRYCRDHAGLVCAADGFYWRDSKGKAGVWVTFNDFIPQDLGEQTRTLLRMTMESPLSSRDAAGHLYAYELRSLSSQRTAFVKVGRTDNVPRRIGQWSNQCTSHTPTLRDVFPLKTLSRQPSRLGSLLPGATKSTDASRMVPFVKRWERLVHLELADRAASSRGAEYGTLLAKCADCGAVHKEIFPLAEPNAYDAVVQAVERWERFVRLIAS